MKRKWNLIVMVSLMSLTSIVPVHAMQILSSQQEKSSPLKKTGKKIASKFFPPKKVVSIKVNSSHDMQPMFPAFMRRALTRDDNEWGNIESEVRHSIEAKVKARINDSNMHFIISEALLQEARQFLSSTKVDQFGRKNTYMVYQSEADKNEYKKKSIERLATHIVNDFVMVNSKSPSEKKFEAKIRSDAKTMKNSGLGFWNRHFGWFPNYTISPDIEVKPTEKEYQLVALTKLNYDKLSWPVRAIAAPARILDGFYLDYLSFKVKVTGKPQKLETRLFNGIVENGLMIEKRVSSFAKSTLIAGGLAAAVYGFSSSGIATTIVTSIGAALIAPVATIIALGGIGYYIYKYAGLEGLVVAASVAIAANELLSNGSALPLIRKAMAVPLFMPLAAVMAVVSATSYLLAWGGISGLPNICICFHVGLLTFALICLWQRKYHKEAYEKSLQPFAKIVKAVALPVLPFSFALTTFSLCQDYFFLPTSVSGLLGMIAFFIPMPSPYQIIDNLFGVDINQNTILTFFQMPKGSNITLHYKMAIIPIAGFIGTLIVFLATSAYKKSTSSLLNTLSKGGGTSETDNNSVPTSNITETHMLSDDLLDLPNPPSVKPWEKTPNEINGKKKRETSKKDNNTNKDNNSKIQQMIDAMEIDDSSTYKAQKNDSSKNKKSNDINNNPNKAGTAFFFATQEGGESAILQLLKRSGPDPNIPYQGKTPFFWACEEGRTEVVKTLLNYTPREKIDVTQGPENKDLPEEYASPLSVAALKGHVEIVDLLLKDDRTPTKVLDLNRAEKAATKGQTLRDKDKSVVGFYWDWSFGGYKTPADQIISLISRKRDEQPPVIFLAF